MKVSTVLGTRPEIIRLSRVIPRLDTGCEHRLVHTGQNFATTLSDVFFAELGVREPDTHLEVRGSSFTARIGQILERLESLFAADRPDRVLVLGDTDGGLATAIVAKRLGLPVYHMEAGNRCFDDRVPEEVNRRLIDHASDVLLPYTERSRENLLLEGVAPRRIRVIGNPINEVLHAYRPRIEASDVLERLAVAHRGFLLMTMHRQETVDVEARLRSLLEGAAAAGRELELPVVVSVHPRTRARIDALPAAAVDESVLRLAEPFGFLDFVRLEEAARCVLSDSGTVQEECCILGVPSVTVRDATERPETLECGSNVLSGVEPEAILRCVRLVLGERPSWRPPREYLETDVSATVARILLAGAGG